MRKRDRSLKARVIATAGITTAVLVTGGAAASYATSRGTAPTLVTASAGPHPVIQTLLATGTTHPSQAATVSFAVSGTVATVPVVMGDKVTTGQVLATLDTTSLKYALATAQGQVANAELTLAQAQSGQVSTASNTSSATGAASSTSGISNSKGTTGTTGTASSKTTTGTANTTGTVTGTRSAGSAQPSGSTASITSAQKLLLTSVRKADSALAKSAADLTLATKICSTQTSAPTTTPTPTPTTPTPTTPRPTTPTPTASPDPSTTCLQAQQLVLTDQSQLLTLQQGLSGQMLALDKLLNSAASSTAGTTTAATTSTGAASAPTTSSGTGTGSTTVAVSAAQLAADQSAVDAAKASLAVAQQQLSQATIVSPFTGVVSSVGLTIGQQATAGSATSAVDVIDPTGHGVTLSVDVAKIPQVKVGQKATVVPDGSTTPLAAIVAYVAAAPTTSGSSAYDVQLAFTANPTKLHDGIQAAVTITTAQATDALAVPTSAVKHLGTRTYVLVLNGSTTKAQTITVGAVGAIYTQVTQGLTTGQRVVLADPSQAIPTNTITGSVARITGGVANTTGGLGGTTSTSANRTGG